MWNPEAFCNGSKTVPMSRSSTASANRPGIRLALRQTEIAAFEGRGGGRMFYCHAREVGTRA